MASPESCITNVIQTATYNQSEREAVDKDFQHDAPCREDIYTPFIQAYSSVGDTILDGFVGTGTVGVGLSMGRNVIGFDVDHESIEFSEKRFEKILSERTSDVESDLKIAA
jgi:DNA modification methylase